MKMGVTQLKQVTFEEDLGREHLDRFGRIPQVVDGCVIQHRLWVPLENRVLLRSLLAHK